MNLVVHYEPDSLIGLLSVGTVECVFVFLSPLCFECKFWFNVLMCSSTSFPGREFVSDF